MAVIWYRVDEEEPPLGSLLVWHADTGAEVLSKFPYHHIGNPELALTHWAIINKPKDV